MLNALPLGSILVAEEVTLIIPLGLLLLTLVWGHWLLFRRRRIRGGTAPGERSRSAAGTPDG